VRFLCAAALCCITAGTGFGQPGPAPYYEDTNNIPVSPEVHADRTVAFRLFWESGELIKWYCTQFWKIRAGCELHPPTQADPLSL